MNAFPLLSDTLNYTRSHISGFMSLQSLETDQLSCIHIDYSKAAIHMSIELTALIGHNTALKWQDICTVSLQEHYITDYFL